MTFAEVKKLVLDQITPQYVSFSWENDYYSDSEVTTECRIYIECVKAHYRGQTWQAAYDRFAGGVLCALHSHLFTLPD